MVWHPPPYYDANTNHRVSGDLVVKVGDFGLTRDIYTLDYYRSSDQFAKLPVKWLPPETFNDRISNEKTDVVSSDGPCQWI